MTLQPDPVTVHGAVTTDHVPAEYIADERTTDPVVLVIQNRYLRRLVIRQEEEIAAREQTIHELLCELVELRSQVAIPANT